MSRYIDADALKKDIARLHVLNDEAEIRRTYEYNPHVTTTDFEETLVSVFDAIDSAPSIDIVRCKECKHAHMTYGGDCKHCDMWKDDDDFCLELYLDGDFYCLDAYEITALIWAMNEYIHNGQFAERI